MQSDQGLCCIFYTLELHYNRVHYDILDIHYGVMVLKYFPIASITEDKVIIRIIFVNLAAKCILYVLSRTVFVR